MPTIPMPQPFPCTPTGFSSRNPQDAEWTHTTARMGRGRCVPHAAGDQGATGCRSWQSHRSSCHPPPSSFGWKHITPLGLSKATETTQTAALVDISLCLCSEQELGHFIPGTFPLPPQSRFYCLDLMKCRLHLDRPISGSSRRQ